MAELLRDVFSTLNIEKLADRIKNNYQKFDKAGFICDAVINQAENNYGERLEQIVSSLYTHLPEDYGTALRILINSLTDGIKDADDFKFSGSHFINLAQSRYISRFGLDYFSVSMDALKAVTKTFTAEFDIRYFLEKYPSETLTEITKWADSDNVHERRLASEGTRPRLPMGRRSRAFVKDPSPILPILEKLKNDPALYVRRSVANSLNDISKDHPDLAADIAERWLKEGFEHAEWVCSHAMRSLFKAGHAKALAISGYPEADSISIDDMQISNDHLKVGDDLTFSFTLQNTSGTDLRIMVDYEIDFVKSNNRMSPKVFKLKKALIKAGEVLHLSARYPVRERTTRKYYSGRHSLSISVNGKKFPPMPFHLEV